MEEINERDLNIVGERYSSFYDVFRVCDTRRFNRVNGPRGDARVLDPMEIAPGVSFDYQMTRNALLSGSDLFQEQFEQARDTSVRAFGERYEWRDTPTSGTSVSGQNVIVERFMAGHPEAFRRATTQLRKKRSVYILYDAMCSASTSVEKRIEAGCAVLVAVEVLEKLGYEVKLCYGLAKFSGTPIATDATLLLEVELKGYGEPLNLLKTQFPIASKSTLFHLGCWWAHRFPRTPVDYGEGEGFPLSYSKGRVKAMELYAEKQRGVYLSEDIVELQLRMDPVKVLQHVLGIIDDEAALESHAKRTTPMASVAQPEQGKIFHSWDPRGELDEEGEEHDEPSPSEGLGEGSQQEGEEAQEPQQGEQLEAMQGFDDGDESESAAAINQASRQHPQHDTHDVGGPQRDSGAQSDGLDGGNEGSQDQQEPARGLGTHAHQREGDGLNDVCRQNDSSHGSGEGSPQGDDDQSESDESGNQDGSEGLGDNTSRNLGDGSEGRDSGDQEGGSESGDGKETDEHSETQTAGSGAVPDEEGDGDEERPRVMKADEEELQTMEDGKSTLQTGEEEFIVELRKRFVRFENGEYLNAMIDQKMARRKAAKEAASNATPAAPVAPGFDPSNPPEMGSRAFAAFAFK